MRGYDLQRRGEALSAWERVNVHVCDDGRLNETDMTGRRDSLSEYRTEFVNSRGIAAVCDVHPSRMRSDSTELHVADYEDMGTAQVVYVIATQLPGFLTDVLPALNHEFVLVTGGADVGVPGELWSGHSMPVSPEEFIGDHRLKHWFAQNCDIEHPKITPIPIGLDYHTLAEPDANRERGPVQPPAEQEALIKAVRSSMPALRDRPLRCLSNFHFSTEGDRPECFEILRGKPFALFQTTPLPRRRVWEAHAHFSFVVSPEGHGMDCHRTWEALVLGSIPIVRRNSLEPLFRGLPVMIVDDWSGLDEAGLLRFKRFAGTGAFDMRKLRLDYWSKKFRMAARIRSE